MNPLERYANDVLAALLIGSFVAFVGASALSDVSLGLSGFRRSVFVNGVALIVLIPTAWVFGPQTLVAVSNLAKAAFVPERVTSSSRTGTPGPSDVDDTGQSRPQPTTDVGKNEQPPADSIRDPVAGHPSETDQARRRMIQSEWPPLDVLLSYVVLTPLVLVLLAPFARVIIGAEGSVTVPIISIAIPQGWPIVLLLVVALVAIAIGWLWVDGSGVGWFVLGAFLLGTVVASRVGVDPVPDNSTASFELAIEGLAALPDQFFLLYFVLVLVVVVWAFGERAATAVALVRRRTTGEQ